MVEAPMTIEISFAAGVGEGAFWLEGEVVLLHPPTKARPVSMTNVSATQRIATPCTGGILPE